MNLNKTDIAGMRVAMKAIEKAVSKYSRKLTALDTLLKAASLLGDQQAQKRLMPLFVKELQTQRHPQKSSDGYTSDELTYVEYCIARMQKGLRSSRSKEATVWQAVAETEH